MGSVIATIVCPICRQCIYEHTYANITLAHCDTLGRTCPMSGQPFGAVSPKAVIA